MSPAAVAEWAQPAAGRARQAAAADRRARAAWCIFGVTGDLARKKLMPAIYDLANRGLLPPGFALVGFARRDWADEDFAQVVHDAVKQHARTPFREEVWEQLAEGIRFVQGTFDDDDAFDRLAEHPGRARRRARHRRQPRLLPVDPAEVRSRWCCEQLATSGLAEHAGDAAGAGWSSRSRSATTWPARASSTTWSTRSSRRTSVFRIDHYLGKETVQNILALRFANQLFEPIWNANYVDHVQITMAEDIGIGGRAGYYDGIGAARDVIQNHLLQLLALTAMEEPVSLRRRTTLRAEKDKVLSAVRLPEDLDQAHRPRPVRRGLAGRREGGRATSRRRASPPDSTTETFAAIRLEVDTRRWAGVPFYLRTGKRLGRRVTEIAVVFKRAPHLPFDAHRRPRSSARTRW